MKVLRPVFFFLIFCLTYQVFAEDRIFEFWGESIDKPRIKKDADTKDDFLASLRGLNVKNNLVDDEPITGTLERIRKADLKTTNSVYVISTGRTDQINNRKLEGFQINLESIITEIINSREAQYERKIILMPSDKDLNARYMSAFYTLSDKYNCPLILRSSLSNEDMITELQDNLNSTFETLSTELSIQPPEEGFETTAAANIEETTQAPLRLKMQAPEPVKAFDSSSKVGIARKTVKKYLSVTR